MIRYIYKIHIYFNSIIIKTVNYYSFFFCSQVRNKRRYVKGNVSTTFGRLIIKVFIVDIYTIFIPFPAKIFNQRDSKRGRRRRRTEFLCTKV